MKKHQTLFFWSNQGQKSYKLNSLYTLEVNENYKFANIVKVATDPYSRFAE